MKKGFKFVLSAGVLSALLCTGAFAATPDFTTDINGTVNYNEGTYTAICDTGITSGNQYVLLVIKGTQDNYSISENTIMYIDQKAASGNSVSFDFIPKNTPECVVLLGGEFTDGTSPKTLGTLTSQGPAIDGDINEDNSVNAADLGILISDFGSSQSNPPENVNSDINGDTSVNVADLSLLITNFGKNVD